MTKKIIMKGWGWGEGCLTLQQPRLKKTPRGGIKIASKISKKISHLVAISKIFYFM